jgi:hypothetical protein
VLKDGYVWGRGTKDDKPVLAANLMTMLLLKRRGVTLDRDVIFLAESAEEADTTGAGINFMVREHFEAIDAEFAITEGGGATLDGSRVTRVSIGTAEKLPAHARLVATGTAGHGSMPRLDNPLLHRRRRSTSWVAGRRRPVRRHPAPLPAPGDDRAARPRRRYRTLVDRRLRAARPTRSATCRARSVVLRDAAHLNRPDHPPGRRRRQRHPLRPRPRSFARCPVNTERFAQMREVVGGGEGRADPQARPPSPASRIDTEMYRVLEQVAQRLCPGSPCSQACPRARAIRRSSAPKTPVMRRRSGCHRGGRAELSGTRRRGTAGESLYPFVRYVHTVVTEVAARK